MMESVICVRDVQRRTVFWIDRCLVGEIISVIVSKFNRQPTVESAH